MKDSTFILMIIILGVVDISISISGLVIYEFLGFQWSVCLIHILVVCYLLWVAYKTIKK